MMGKAKSLMWWKDRESAFRRFWCFYVSWEVSKYETVCVTEKSYSMLSIRVNVCVSQRKLTCVWVKALAWNSTNPAKNKNLCHVTHIVCKMACSREELMLLWQKRCSQCRYTMTKATCMCLLSQMNYWTHICLYRWWNAHNLSINMFNECSLFIYEQL